VFVESYKERGENGGERFLEKSLTLCEKEGAAAGKRNTGGGARKKRGRSRATREEGRTLPGRWKLKEEKNVACRLKI